MTPGLVLSFDPPLGLVPLRSRVTNGSQSLRATVCDVEGRELVLAPGEAVEAVFWLGFIAKGPPRG